MKNLNESLLESIDLIQESTIESELNVLFAMGEEYAKACTLMEYADESVVNEFDLIQESAFFMEAKKDDAAEEKKEGEAKGDKKGNPIVRFFNYIGPAIIGIFKWLAKKFGNTEKKVNTKIKGKEKAALEKILNNTLAGVMGEVDVESTDEIKSTVSKAASKDVKSAKEIYTLSKKKTFKVETPNNQISILVNMPFFYDKFEAVAKNAVKKSKDQVSFEFKNMVTFEYVSLSEIVGRITAESNKISTFINSELPKLAAESKLAGKNEQSADALGSHLKSMTEGFQGRMLRASMAFYDIVDTVVSDVMDKDLTAE